MELLWGGVLPHAALIPAARDAGCGAIGGEVSDLVRCGCIGEVGHLVEWIKRGGGGGFGGMVNGALSGSGV